MPRDLVNEVQELARNRSRETEARPPASLPSTAQEIFDTVAKHLAAQGRMSKRTVGICRYRGPEGLKCAVGVLILDDEYSADMDDRDDMGDTDCSLASLVKRDQLPSRLVEHAELLQGLQQAHDSRGGDIAWRLENVAREHRLSYDTLDTLTFPKVWA